MKNKVFGLLAATAMLSTGISSTLSLQSRKSVVPKAPLSKKQKASRKKSKQANAARKKNRK